MNYLGDSVMHFDRHQESYACGSGTSAAQRAGSRWLALLGVVALLASGSASAQQLQELRASSIGEGLAQLALRFSSTPPDATIFVIDSPPRIAMDLPGVSNLLAERTTNFDLGALESVTAVEAGGRTRVILNLARGTDYRSHVDGNNLVLTVGPGAGDPARVSAPIPAAVPAAVAAPPAVVAPRPTGVRSARPPEINDVDFRRGTEGQGRVIIELSRPGVSVDVREQANRVELRFPRVLMDDALVRRLNVVDFATPVTSIDTVRERDDRVLITVNASGDFEVLSYQTDNRFVLEVAAVTEEQQQAQRLLEGQEYVGERLSLSFQDIEVRSVLQLLADFTDLNIVVSDSVTGNITLRLNNVPWDQALDIILTSRGLDKRVSGNVMYVAPTQEIAARERLILEAERDRRELEPLRTEFIRVNFTEAETIRELIQARRDRRDDEARVSFLSDRGSVAVDSRTNTLIVRDTVEQIEQVRSLVSTLDIPTQQVLIETRVVIADDEFRRELGVRFGVSRSGTTTGLAGRLEGADAIRGLENPAAAALANRLNVALPATGDRGSIGFSLLRSNVLLDLELSALQFEGRGEIIASPRVITANGQTAKISQGDRIPYRTLDEAGNTVTSFEDALLETEVRPQITPNGDVIMTIRVTKNEPNLALASVAGSDELPIRQREVSTQVSVASGETVVLGGVYEIRQDDIITKVPFFGDIPFVRNFFRKQENFNRKIELLVFVTPRVLE